MSSRDIAESLRRLKRLDSASRSRILGDARRGKVGDDADEASLLAAASHHELIVNRWTIGLTALLAALNVVSSAVVDDRVIRSVNLVVVALAMVATLVFALRARRFSRTERLNLERIGQL